MIPMEREANIQDEVLERFKTNGTTITVYLTRGNRLTGKIMEHDRYTIMLNVEGQPHLIYKHAISTVVEAK